MITIIIKTLQGESSDFDIEESDTIEKFIGRYRSEKKLDGKSQVSLSYNGNTLNAGKTFQEQGITVDGTELHALIRLKGC